MFLADVDVSCLQLRAGILSPPPGGWWRTRRSGHGHLWSCCNSLESRHTCWPRELRRRTDPAGRFGTRNFVRSTIREMISRMSYARRPRKCGTCNRSRVGTRSGSPDLKWSSSQKRFHLFSRRYRTKSLLEIHNDTKFYLLYIAHKFTSLSLVYLLTLQLQVGDIVSQSNGGWDTRLSITNAHRLHSISLKLHVSYTRHATNNAFSWIRKNRHFEMISDPEIGLDSRK